MRLVRLISAVLFVSLPLLATDLTVRVVDPQSAVVPGARVSVFTLNSRAVAVTTTAGDGTALVKNIPDGSYRLQILAPGFRESDTSLQLPSTAVHTVKLMVASASESVVVTAAATPIAEDESGASVSALGADSIRLLDQPSVSDLLRLLPGAYLADSGHNGGITTLFVRGGESNYNKVIVDGVPVNDAGGTFNFGVVPSDQVDRIELVRGADSTLYGSDAMTSVVQIWTAPGKTRVPELRFGSDGGTFATAHGNASLSGANGRFDYNVFGDEFHTQGQGINDAYENSLQGANLGARLSDAMMLRLRLRHSNSRSGVQGAWDYSTGIIPPDSDQYARQNDFLASLDLTVATSSRWQQRFSGFEYNHVRRNVDHINDNRPFDDPFDSRTNFNRAGFDYQSDYTERSWARSVFGYHFEDENGFIADNYVSYGFPGSSLTHGLRRNQAVYGEQFLALGRATLIAGLRYEHNESFGDKAVPRVAMTYLLLRRGHIFSGTRLRASYSEGIKAPTFEESFGITGSYPTVANPDLQPEQARSLEAGFLQSFVGGRYSLSAVYFNNRFTNQIDYKFDPVTFVSQYININRALAHGVEVSLHAQLRPGLALSGGYTYTSTQALSAPLCTPGSGCTATGQPLLRRPKHFGDLLLTYSKAQWGASLSGTFVGRRPDSDFLFGAIPPIYSAPGYARFDATAWRAINHHVTAYAAINNLLNHRYQEVVGYPALKANFRAGLRFRFGGD